MSQPIQKKLKKGELLFNEGDPSRTMYFVQGGTLRLFKKKGTSSIELGLIHKGEVIGEMGFMDGGPRSASAEAMHDTDLTEITNINLAEQLKIFPPWLMVLLKTIVNRLRSANNKIRQLETSSTAYTYGSDGVSTTYQFLSVYDVLKTSTALLVAGARNGVASPGGSMLCTMRQIEHYANHIMGVHQSKIEEFVNILEQVGLTKVDRSVLDKIQVYIMDLDQIEALIQYLNEENLKEHKKQIVIGIKGVNVMGFIAKNIELFPPNKEGVSVVNLYRILEIEKQANQGKEPFRMDDLSEVIKVKLASDLALKDNNTILTNIKTAEFIRAYRIQKIVKLVEAVNEKKREQVRTTSPTRNL